MVKEYKLEKGASVEVTIHPMTGAVTIRPGVLYAEQGQVTGRFERAIDDLLDRRVGLYEELAK